MTTAMTSMAATCGNRPAMAEDELADPVDRAVGCGLDRPAAQVALDVIGQGLGRGVAPVRFGMAGLGHDDVEFAIAADGARRLCVALAIGKRPSGSGRGTTSVSSWYISVPRA